MPVKQRLLIYVKLGKEKKIGKSFTWKEKSTGKEESYNYLGFILSKNNSINKNLKIQETKAYALIGQLKEKGQRLCIDS